MGSSGGFRSGAAILAFVVGLAAGGAQAATKAGVAAGVVGDVMLSGGERSTAEPAESGSDIFTLDDIATGDRSRMQALFVDETALTLGPNSKVTIDRFVFDPDNGSGAMVANFLRGSMRFVSGRTAALARQEVRIKTPVGTMGIRGTSTIALETKPETEFFIGLLGPGMENNYGAAASQITFSNEKGSQQVDKAGVGFFVEVGKAPGPLVIIPDSIRNFLSQPLKGAPQSETSAGESQGSDQTGDAGGSLNGQSTESAAGQTTASLQETTVDLSVDNTTSVQEEGNEQNQIEEIMNMAGGQTGMFDVNLAAFIEYDWTQTNLSDFDAHLTGPDGSGGRFHVYFSNLGSLTGSPFAALDQDCLGAACSEVITIQQFTQGDVYRSSLFHFGNQASDSTDIVNNRANLFMRFFQDGTIVRQANGGSAIVGGTAVLTLQPPTSGAGNTWVGAVIDPATGVITSVDQIVTSTDSASVQ